MYPLIKSEGARIYQGHILIPRGLALVCLLQAGDQFAAYVQGWPPPGEVTHFDVYPLDGATPVTHHVKLNDKEEDQNWLVNFGEPTKQATLASDGSFLIHDRV